MPYISKEERPNLDKHIDPLAEQIRLYGETASAGRLNYTMTRLALAVYPRKQYWALALVVGVFVTAMLEYYRRWVTPYEDGKIKDNGDVYE